MATLAVGSSMTPSSRDQQQLKKPKRNILVKAAASPRSRILKLPEITKMTAANDEEPTETPLTSAKSAMDHFPMPMKRGKNPFHMPSDMEVFAMREEERKLKHEAKEKLKNQSIYEKNVVNRKNFKELLAEDDDDVEFYDQLRKRDADKILAEEQKLLDDEKALEEDAAKFDAFLKENDKNSVEAIKR
ncbi:hypothetical protein HDU67_010332, partial [Dinochytrium kinnereticum]